MVATFPTTGPKGDLPASIQAALGAGAKVKIDKPSAVLLLRDEGISVTIQADGQVAIFSTVGLIACECQGNAVFSIPDWADLIGVLRHGDVMVIIFRDENQFYSKRGQKFTALKTYDPTARIVANGDDPLADNDEDGGCDLWHLNDSSLNDLVEYSDDMDEPRVLPTYDDDDD